MVQKNKISSSPLSLSSPPLLLLPPLTQWKRLRRCTPEKERRISEKRRERKEKKGTGRKERKEEEEEKEASERKKMLERGTVTGQGAVGVGGAGDPPQHLTPGTSTLPPHHVTHTHTPSVIIHACLQVLLCVACSFSVMCPYHPISFCMPACHRWFSAFSHCHACRMCTSPPIIYNINISILLLCSSLSATSLLPLWTDPVKDGKKKEENEAVEDKEESAFLPSFGFGPAIPNCQPPSPLPLCGWAEKAEQASILRALPSTSPLTCTHACMEACSAISLWIPSLPLHTLLLSP